MERTTCVRGDLYFGSAVSLALHAALALVVGLAAMRSQGIVTPPALQSIRLDLDLPATVAETDAAADPSAAASENATPLAAVVPRPLAVVPPERRYAPAPAPQELAPAAPESVAQGGLPAGNVATVVAPETTGKRAFGTGVAAAPDTTVAGDATAATESDGVGIEGPVSFHHLVKPLYPIGARQRGEEGRVVLEATVAPSGRPTTVSVSTSSRFAELDRAALHAIERASFTPATEHGLPVEAQARITIVFRLTN